ncbi:hypothetical protein Hypma_002972 [Hypsizygus marmoreus]|uniref:Uncharacterized protein n=1 Tax=Hypsizygus marmoreus TaxID=39966 RepID=A0A369JAQ6_HYPMA|nr:hypothetical protein Hypma_002972 [Hypsizygus marmoreus]
MRSLGVVSTLSIASEINVLRDIDYGTRAAEERGTWYLGTLSTINLNMNDSGHRSATVGRCPPPPTNSCYARSGENVSYGSHEIHPTSFPSYSTSEEQLRCHQAQWTWIDPFAHCGGSSMDDISPMPTMLVVTSDHC